MAALKREYLPNYTYSDYLQWQGDWEMIYGIPYAMAPSPSIAHQSISNKIARYLDEALEECQECKALLPIDWKVSENTIVQPDNLVICHKPLHANYIAKAPKIIFEILSPSTAIKDQNMKYELYEQEGVAYYVIVNPKDGIAKLYKLNEGRYIKVADVSDESVEFDLDKCSFSFDFSKIW
ncbi:MAG: Uma2 family endonuclease [Campylobacterota bacterium]|nr:Uma2 family endonuclease [Campylobacterota bacterium]